MEDEEADVVGTISADVLLEVTILRDTSLFERFDLFRIVFILVKPLSSALNIITSSFSLVKSISDELSLQNNI